MSLCIF